MSKTHYTEVY